MSALEQHWSVKTVCARFDISEKKVRQAMHKKPGEPGYLHSILVGLDSRRIPESALKAWLNETPRSASVASVHSLEERRQA
jgi:hypothetical protein